MARVSLEIEVNIIDYPDGSLNQDTDNDIITLRQHGPTLKIIEILYLDNNTTFLTSTYPYLHPTNDKSFQASQNYIMSVKLSSYIYYCPCSNNIHDTESDHTWFHTNTIVRNISLLVMWYLKLQTHINLLLTSTSFPTISHIITFLTTKGIEIYKILNLSCCQIITFKTNFNEYFISALRPTHRGLGCNAYHSNFYLLTLHLFYSYVTSIMFLTRTQSFAKNKLPQNIKKLT